MEVSVELFQVAKSFFVLQLTQQMHEKIMTVMLKCWFKLLLYQAFQTDGIENFSLSLVAGEGVGHKLCELARVLVRV